MGFAIEKKALEILVNDLLSKSRLFEQFCLLA
ncbi:hypothetical protein A1S_3896 [Acinetobacter baumannii ATCC 17978]|nr:hypothetical protein A1S_3896 [Acinetobacter baumannii ATCC 17978]